MTSARGTVINARPERGARNTRTRTNDPQICRLISFILCLVFVNMFLLILFLKSSDKYLSLEMNMFVSSTFFERIIVVPDVVGLVE